MTATNLAGEWKNFAEAVGGSVSGGKATRFQLNNTYSIKTPTEEVVLTWAIEPERGRGTQVKQQTVFRFNLKVGATPYLRVYPRDLLSGLLSAWNRNRRRTGDPALDKAYILLASEQVPISSAVHHLQRFHQQNRHRSFFIDTGKEAGTPALVIQVNELLTQAEDLHFFYGFGKKLAEVLESGV